MLKKMKMDTPSAPVPEFNGGERKTRASMTVEEVDEDMETDTEAQNFAPGGDADYFVEEDEGGRFFGSGLTSEQKDILNLFDGAEGGGLEDEVSPSFNVQLTLIPVTARGADDNRNTEDATEIRTCSQQEPRPTIQVSQ